MKMIVTVVMLILVPFASNGAGSKSTRRGRPAASPIVPVTKAWDRFDCPGRPGSSLLTPRVDPNLVAPQRAGRSTNSREKANR